MARMSKIRKAIAIETTREMEQILAEAIDLWVLETIRDDMRQWVPISTAVRLHPNLENYVRGLGVAPSGAETLDIADKTADLLRGLTIDLLYWVVSEELEKLGKEASSKSFIRAFGKDTPWKADNLHDFLYDRYSGRNNGMQRMNLGNVLRAAQNRVGVA